MLKPIKPLSCKTRKRQTTELVHLWYYKGNWDDCRSSSDVQFILAVYNFIHAYIFGFLNSFTASFPITLAFLVWIENYILCSDYKL